ncbi:MAG TPA: hypothetical protein VGZ23_20635 [bacterium]|nr:hypothetical protein [bacterium]
MRNFIEVDEQELGRPHVRRRNPIFQGAMPASPATPSNGPLLTFDILRQDLYTFYQAAVATALTAQTLFQQGIGGFYTPIGGTAFQLTELHTNLIGTGTQLPNPQRFMTQGIFRLVREDILPKDLVMWNFGTLVNLTIGDTTKKYCTAQLALIPQNNAIQVQVSGGAAAQTAPANASTFATTGWPVTDNFYALLASGLLDPDTGQEIKDAGITIDQGQNFGLILDPTLGSGAFSTYTTATSATGGTGIQAYFHLKGVLGRSVQ